MLCNLQETSALASMAAECRCNARSVEHVGNPRTTGYSNRVGADPGEGGECPGSLPPFCTVIQIAPVGDLPTDASEIQRMCLLSCERENVCLFFYLSLDPFPNITGRCHKPWLSRSR